MEKNGRLFLALVLSGVLLVAGVSSLLLDTFLNVPDFKEMRGAIEVTTYLPNKEKGKRKVGPKAPGWVSYSQVSSYLMLAVISSEDASFFSHDGVDYHEIRQAMKKDLETGRFARGGSTITQQVIKNAYLGREKTLWRKFKEFFWARELEKVLSKSEIVTFYVNLVEWGPGIYGINAAARHYFSVSPAQLSAKQAAFLAMLLPSPVKYHVYFQKKNLTKWASSRVRHILRVMFKMKFMDESTYHLALSEPLWGDEGVIEDVGVTPEEGMVEEPNEEVFEFSPVESPPSDVPLSDSPPSDALPSDVPPSIPIEEPQTAPTESDLIPLQDWDPPPSPENTF